MIKNLFCVGAICLAPILCNAQDIPNPGAKYQELLAEHPNCPVNQARAVANAVLVETPYELIEKRYDLDLKILKLNGKVSAINPNLEEFIRAGTIQTAYQASYECKNGLLTNTRLNISNKEKHLLCAEYILSKVVKQHCYTMKDHVIIQFD